MHLLLIKNYWFPLCKRISSYKTRKYVKVIVQKGDSRAHHYQIHKVLHFLHYGQIRIKVLHFNVWIEKRWNIHSDMKVWIDTVRSGDTSIWRTNEGYFSTINPHQATTLETWIPRSPTLVYWYIYIPGILV